MKHAGEAALAGLAGLISQIRAHPGLVERKAGVFYRNGRAFLHFHEDPAGMFADLRTGAEWGRFPVNSHAEKAALLVALERVLGTR
jgi:hypothetical protein